MTLCHHNSIASACPVCGSGDVDVFMELPNIPVHCNILWQTRTLAIEAPRADMKLGFCRDCTHIFNTAFDPSLVTYNEGYENSLQFSPRYRAYAEAQAKHLIDRYDLHGKVVVDIGCGKGDFLRLIGARGNMRGFGVDPTLSITQPISIPGEQITFIRDTYSERYKHLDADLVCCRQVLEHLIAPKDLLLAVHRAVVERKQTTVFFEVPNALFTLRDMGIWDLIYEHISYFTPGSLMRALELAGFEIDDLRETYDGQYLCIEAHAITNSTTQMHTSPDTRGVATLVADFANSYLERKAHWCSTMEAMSSSGERAVIWGAGSKGVSFLNAIEPLEAVDCVVDISPRKHGMYIAGTGHRVIEPASLGNQTIDKILVMNAIYSKEIGSLIESLGLTAELVCV